MSSPASPLTADSDLVSFVIKAGGTDVDQRYDIVSLTVERALNRIPTARLVVRDGSAADESFSVSAGSDFAPGVQLEIQAGYHGTNVSVFTGIVVKASIQQLRGGDSSLTITCRDAAVAMTIGRKSACYTSTTDGDVMTTLVTNNGLTADVASTTDQLEEITQFAASDWDFFLSRAEANGLVVQVVDGKVTAKAPDFSATPVLGVTYGLDILEVSLEEDVRTQFSSVTCSAWDPSTQALVTSSDTLKNDNPLGGDKSTVISQVTGASPFLLNTTTPIPTAALKTWADAQLLKSTLAKIRGTVLFQGSSSILPGNLLTLSGLGERFDGNAYVSAVTHEIRDNNWTTEATIGLDPAWFTARPDVSAPQAYGLLPGVQGLQIGTVKQINADPAGQFRVLVLVPIIDNTGKGIWARLARPYATNTAGSFFYPEVGDEVVLAFLDSDPRFPIIVGSLFSSSRPPPYTPDEKNTQKAIVTNSQLKLIFDDDKKVITLITPGGNSVVISDDAKSITMTDQNSNSVKLSSDGITLSSAKDVKITAAQNITMEAQAGNFSAKGTNGSTISGLTVALKADTEFTAQGSASAAVTSSGETTIKGSIVMIN